VIKFTATAEDGSGVQIVGLGLEARNLDLLQQDKPILVKFAQLNLDYPVEVLIFFAGSGEAQKWLAEQTRHGVKSVHVNTESADAEHLGGRLRAALGATGRFPLGKITPDDKGETAFRVGHDQRRVILEFGQAMRWLGLDKETALRLADKLREHAAHAD
jgi:hypothetical protein